MTAPDAAALRAAMEARLFSRVVKDGDCWRWTGYCDNHGYGQIDVGGRVKKRVYRYLYERNRGPVPDGLELDHLCRNRWCVNPDHLEAVTHRENLLRGNTSNAAYAARTHCGNGHPLSGSNLIVRDRGRRCRACEKNRRAERAIRARGAADKGESDA